MDIKTIPLSSFEANLQATLNECADSGKAIVVELPDQRLIAIQSLDTLDADSLVDDLLQTNVDFQKMVSKSKASARKPF